MKELKPEHHVAIHYLSQPKKGGLTMEKIAQECGVTRKTVYEWKKDDLFNRELKKQIIRNTIDRLPEVNDAMASAAIEDRNAAAAKLIYQMNELLSDSLHVETSEKKDEGADIDHLRELAKKYADEDAE
ncbi:phBC6A51 family helix-turn-helix protein [Paludifilum halophilum]|uniref:phBC6A51 family helix-turn-helix protein n=1 Tax=Paludifilum halophilum TaxID=1642702 RepID=UPI00146F3304|nr:phBC6A51 family helix-turn-helix protein [Paludifilum halophilum]